MKKNLPILLLLAAQKLHADTTIDATQHLAYGANIGWLDCRGDNTHGAVIGEAFCSGSIYAANVGWINLGNGAPANGIQYQNTSAADFGVNHDGSGHLRGYAWGANIGWIAFEDTGSPAVNLLTGQLSGAVWSANCGWLSLSNLVASVRTSSLSPGPTAPNGLPVAWLLSHFGTTNVNANADADQDGYSNAQEYLAGTDPNNASSVLRITSIHPGMPNTNSMAITWTSVPNRSYVLQQTTALPSGTWSDLTTNSTLGWNNATINGLNPTNGFFRVRVYRPLMP